MSVQLKSFRLKYDVVEQLVGVDNVQVVKRMWRGEPLVLIYDRGSITVAREDPEGSNEVEYPRAASFVFRGDVGKVSNAYATILFWVIKNNYDVTQPTYEIYRSFNRDTNEVEVEVVVPIVGD